MPVAFGLSTLSNDTISAPPFREFGDTTAIATTVKFQQGYGHYVAAPVVKGKDLCSLLPTDIGKAEAYFYKSEILLKASVAELAKALVFDFLIGNLDRHNGHVYKSDSGKLYLSDHERSFGDSKVLFFNNVLRHTLKAKRHLDELIETDFQAVAIAVAESFEPYLQER
ncbi:MAG: hypothetical protein H7Z11_14505, partial [Verrucomicrobia bacterium]|nr:hypothetical protein [Leptolyngbya sp. ES-bin-22]